MEPRKATDILLAIEVKIDQILAVVRAQDLNTKVLSNKLNAVIAQLNNLEIEPGEGQPFTPAPSIEVPVMAPEPSLNITVEADPLGFRRTSRPETYATPTQLAQISKPSTPPTAPISQAPVVHKAPVPSAQEEWKTISMPALPRMQSEEVSANIGKISVEQRIVDKNGKAVFLANVEVFNKSSNKLETKTRTTSAGKWQAVLPPGNYDVKITKSESMSKEKIELKQEVIVDGKNPTQTLPMVIVK